MNRRRPRGDSGRLSLGADLPGWGSIANTLTANLSWACFALSISETHLNPDQVAQDQARSQILAAQGIRVLRFTNDQVLNQIDEVLSNFFQATLS